MRKIFPVREPRDNESSDEIGKRTGKKNAKSKATDVDRSHGISIAAWVVDCETVWRNFCSAYKSRERQTRPRFSPVGFFGHPMCCSCVSRVCNITPPPPPRYTVKSWLLSSEYTGFLILFRTTNIWVCCFFRKHLFKQIWLIKSEFLYHAFFSLFSLNDFYTFGLKIGKALFVLLNCKYCCEQRKNNCSHKHFDIYESRAMYQSFLALFCTARGQSASLAFHRTWRIEKESCGVTSSADLFYSMQSVKPVRGLSRETDHFFFLPYLPLQR